MPTYLLSKALDPLLGLFTGLLAYHLHENNPRTAPPPGHTLRELASWQWTLSKQQRDERARLEEEKYADEMEKLRNELVSHED